MAIPLVLLTPFIGAIAKKLTSKARDIVIQKIKEKTGINIETKADADQALAQLSPEGLKDIKLAVLKSDEKMFLAELKNGEDLSKTWKDDAVTYAHIFYVAFLFVLGAFNSDKVLSLIKAITPLFETYFGLTYLLVMVSAVGLRSVCMKVADGFIKKYS
jgi:hypothetical protein